MIPISKCKLESAYFFILRPCYTGGNFLFLATCNATMMNKKSFKLQSGCYTQATCLNVEKSRGSFYFSCNSQCNNCSCKMGCYNAMFVALQVARKTVSCNMAFSRSGNRIFQALGWYLGLQNQCMACPRPSNVAI